ncbi:MAG: DUF4280 domain-containing protein [Dehalococcoidia bacterium]
MAQLVVNGAMLACTPWGAAPSSMVVLPKNRVNAGGQPAANIMDNIPMTNIMPFGVCTSLANPQVAAATSAALGVLTPQPCIPVTPAPWAPGSPTVMLGGAPALNSTSKLTCTWGGVIGVNVPGQFTVNVP